MGMCLGKHRKKKRNTVSPSSAADDSAYRRRKAPCDMIADRKAANAEDAKISSAGVSFTVDFQGGDPTIMPSRLADRLDGAITPTEDDNEIQYTSEEKQMLVQLMRDDILRERKEKAARSSGIQHT